MSSLIAAIREIMKAALVAFFWMIPLYLRAVSGSDRYLWFFLLSFLLTCVTFTHYETLEVEESPEEHKVTVEDLYPKKDD